MPVQSVQPGHTGHTGHTEPVVRLFEGDADDLLSMNSYPDRVTLLPGAGGKIQPGERLRVLWGQDLLRDLLDSRYRTVVCGVNDTDNSHGIIAQLVELISTSQWSSRSVTSYARMFHGSVAIHAASDKEPYILKFDLDSLLILGILRPSGRQHFTIEDLRRGFGTITKMLHDRRERLPVATVSFLSAKANRLVGDGGAEPSFEAVLRTMYESGFRGDVYPAPSMWRNGQIGVFPSYPFPAGLERMRAGSS